MNKIIVELNYNRLTVLISDKYIFNKETTTFSEQATANRKKELKTLKDGEFATLELTEKQLTISQ